MTQAPPVKFTHREKMMFPEVGLTKGNIIDFYDAVAPRLLPYLKNRPMTLERLPDGLAGERSPHFWQKNAPSYYPDWIPRVSMPTEDGRKVNYVLVNDRDSLLYLVNQGTITFHPWLSTADDPDRPTFVLFDIDPHQSTFANAIKTAKALHDVLDEQGVKSFVKTSGKSGLHVMTPWKSAGGFAEAREWASGIAQRVVDRIPDIATTQRSIRKRGRRVYLDVEQNARGKHVVPPYVVRATPRATVSMPLEWKELTARLDPSKFTIDRAQKRILARQDPMRGLLVRRRL